MLKIDSDYAYCFVMTNDELCRNINEETAAIRFLNVKILHLLFSLQILCIFSIFNAP